MMQSPRSENALRRRSAGASAEGGVVYGGYERIQRESPPTDAAYQRKKPQILINNA